MQHDLMDELHLLVDPVVVGSGARLVPDGSTGNLKLVDQKTFSSGVVALILSRSRPNPRSPHKYTALLTIERVPRNQGLARYHTGLAECCIAVLIAVQPQKRSV